VQVEAQWVERSVGLELVEQSQVELPQALLGQVQQFREQRFRVLQSQARSVAVRLRVEAVFPLSA